MQSDTQMIVVGTRPEIIKMAPVHAALRKAGKKVMVLHTGQHDAVAHSLYQFFDMPPDFSISLNKKTSALSHLTVALIEGLEDLVSTVPCSTILVQGDTTSALCGALCGFYHDIPVAHVEAGLRTRAHDPFPEEKNREMIGRLARWHFPPTSKAAKNLMEEGIPSDRVFNVGNTVIDAALSAREKIGARQGSVHDYYPPETAATLQQIGDARTILVTAHRRENWGEPIRNIAQAVATIVRDFDDVVAVWPVHPNPAVVNDIQSVVANLPEAIRQRIVLTSPLTYPAMIDQLSHCVFTLTDSGGIQEEASAFSKPVLVARISTERQELIEAGGGRLVGTDPDLIYRNAKELLTDPVVYDRMRIAKCPFGNGRAAEDIVEILNRN